MNRPYRYLFIFVLTGFAFTCFPAAAGENRNPITSYFSRFLDETGAEIAVGKILFEALVAESGGQEKVITSPEMDKAAQDLARNAPRNSIPYRVYIIESPIPSEIPFPGGPIVLTSGMVSLLQSKEDRDFILARNIMHISLRHPMMAVKRENLYAKILRISKRASGKVDQENRQRILRDYIKASVNMDQIKADKEGVSLTVDPSQTRKAALDLLKRWSKALWPATMPWEGYDFSARIQALEAIP